MKINSKKLEKNQMELIIEVSVEEMKPNLEAAASRLAKEIKIEGFRPGKAPYDVIKSRVGEMAILEEAMNDVVGKTFGEAVRDESLMAVGPPKIEIQKMAPNNPLVYKAVVSLLPKLKLADLKTIKVQKKKIEVTKEKIDKTIAELRKMQKKEALTDKPATKKDKVVVDMDMHLDKVPVDGGQTKDHQVFLSDDHYVPGLQDQLVGLKKGDKKNFALPFPEEHYNKGLAGKNVDFSVHIKDVFEVILPDLNDEFAKKVGLQTMDDLKKQISANIKHEDEEKEGQRLEGEIVDEMIKKSEFDDIPDNLIDGEIEKMIHELEHSISHQGLSFDDYLKHIKKTKEQLKEEFLGQAERRVRGSLLMREIAIEQNFTSDDKEVQNEVDRLLAMYKNDEAAQGKIKEDGYKEFLRNVLVNRKVIDYLKKNCVES